MTVGQREAAPALGGMLQILQGILAALGCASSVPAIAEAALGGACAALGAAVGAVVLVADEGAALEPVAVAGHVEREALVAGGTPIAEAVQRRETVWLCSAQEAAARLPGLPPALVGATAAVPLLLDDRARGCLWLCFDGERRFAPDEQAFLSIVAAQCAQATARQLQLEALQRELAERTRAEQEARQQAEQALAASELRFRALIEHSTDAIEVIGADGKLKYASPTTPRVLGYSVEEFGQLYLGELVHPDDRSTLRAILTELLRRPGESAPIAGRARHKDGSWRSIEGTATNLLHVPELQAVVINYRDATAHRWTEAALQQAKEQLEAILRAVDDGITVQDPAGRLLFCNDAAARMTGYPSAAALQNAPPGELLARWEILDESGAPLPPERLPGRRARESASNASALIQYRDRQTGEQRWSMVRAVPVADEHGSVKFAVSVTQDVTELHRALEETRAALAIRQRFLSVASHELRTPLTALKGQLQLVRRRLARGVPAELLDASLLTADRQLDRLNRLVGELLDVSRLSEGRFSVSPEPLDLGDLLRRVVQQQRDVVPERPILLLLDALPRRLDADPFRLEQALINLIRNADKYSPAGSPIVVRARVADRRVLIDVQDQGIGVPAEEREAIFEPFHRAANVDRAVTGLGLGLYIARELARLHGGTLTVETGPQGGSVFTLALPLHAA